MPESEAEILETAPDEATSALSQTSVKPFPSPPRPKTKGGGITPDQLFKYWKGLPDELSDRWTLYVNRDWPVLNHLQGLPPEQQEEALAGKRKLFKYIDKIGERFDSDDWRTELLRRYGSGDYKLYLNDSGVRGTKIKSGNVCRCKVVLRDEEFPPALETYMELLDMKDPANSSYIQSLRLRGIRLPGEGPALEEVEEDMANQAAVDKLADTVVQLTRDRTTNQGQQPAPTQDGSAVAEAAREGIKILSECVRTSRELESKTQDPQEYHKNIMSAAAALAPPPAVSNNSDLILKMMDMQERHAAQMQAQAQSHQDALLKQMELRLAFAEKVASEARAMTVMPPVNQVPPSGTPVQSPVSVLDTAIKLIGAVEKLRGTVNPAGENDGPWWAPLLEKGTETVQTVAQAYANAQYNAAVASSKTGQPMPPAPVQTQQIEEEEDQTESQMVQNYLKQLHQPLVQALHQNINGAQFASDLTKAYGQQTYTWLKAQGKEGLVRLLSSYQPLWADCIRFPNLETFLDQFLGNVPQQPQVLKPEVVPPTQGRRVVRPDGKVVNVEHQGPVVNATVEKEPQTPVV
jgi:hypothetical protein